MTNYGPLTHLEADAAVKRCLADGLIEPAGMDHDGEPMYRMTDAGRQYLIDKRVEQLRRRRP